WEAALPQHDLALAFPESRTGRYVRFSNMNPNQGEVGWGWGWNEYFANVLMNAHLAYMSERAYVFQEYAWEPQHFRWSKANL
ncbi:hypothetical protein B0H13DRAFT_1624058, partial [Mycena leptocephala]